MSLNKPVPPDIHPITEREQTAQTRGKAQSYVERRTEANTQICGGTLTTYRLERKTIGLISGEQKATFKTSGVWSEAPTAGRKRSMDSFLSREGLETEY